MGDGSCDGETRERIDQLAVRFGDAVYMRVHRTGKVLGKKITPEDVDQSVADWLGAAAHEILKD